MKYDKILDIEDLKRRADYGVSDEVLECFIALGWGSDRQRG